MLLRCSLNWEKYKNSLILVRLLFFKRTRTQKLNQKKFYWLSAFWYFWHFLHVIKFFLKKTFSCHSCQNLWSFRLMSASYITQSQFSKVKKNSGITNVCASRVLHDLKWSRSDHDLDHFLVPNDRIVAHIFYKGNW